jgi:hypothetical protein
MTGVILGTVGGAIALLLGETFHRMHLAAQGSEVSAVSSRLAAALPRYYASHRRYPTALSELQLDLSSADGAMQDTFRFVRYSSDGAAFTYAEVGPDEWHRRVWWCYGPDTCRMAELR